MTKINQSALKQKKKLEINISQKINLSAIQLVDITDTIALHTSEVVIEIIGVRATLISV